jgi:hypothetical protein|tara:strand:+ start:242 stop:574 length:333 start_codon:yes stop_codon:yes gene_type:complete
MIPLTVEVPGRNKLEKEYGQYLATLKRAGEIIDFRYEPLSLRLGHSAWYKPDFLVIKEDCFELHETKGRAYEAGIVRLKACATKYPWFRFFLVKAGKKGQWNVKAVRAEY